MPENKNAKLKKIDCHADHLLSSLLFSATVALSNVCDYMQSTTPYGEEYRRAFDLYMSIRSQFDELEDALQSCVEARMAKEGKR